MKASLTSIGNSKGIRIPAALIKQCGLEDEVELTVKGQNIIISRARKPRAGWSAQFVATAPNAPSLLIDDGLDLDTDDWQW